MNRLVSQASVIKRLVSGEIRTSRTPTLIIGDMERWQRLKTELPEADGFVFSDVDDLNNDLLATVEPEIILSPLIVREFDAIEISRRLGTLGFLGRYRVVTDQLPDASVIISEIREQAPSIDFDILNLPEATLGAGD